jgi:hypothetical protein
MNKKQVVRMILGWNNPQEIVHDPDNEGEDIDCESDRNDDGKTG